MDLDKPLLPLEEASSQARLAIGLVLKLIATLRDIGKLEEDEFTTVAASVIAELQGDRERFDAWGVLESLVEGYKRPDQNKKHETEGDKAPSA